MTLSLSVRPRRRSLSRSAGVSDDTSLLREQASLLNVAGGIVAIREHNFAILTVHSCLLGTMPKWPAMRPQRQYVRSSAGTSADMSSLSGQAWQLNVIVAICGHNLAILTA